MSHNAIVKQGPLADNIEAFKAYQVDPECAVVLARGDLPADNPAAYRLFLREEDASASRFLALGYDRFFAVSLRPVQAGLTYPNGEDSIIVADVKAAVIDPVAYLVVAAGSGDDLFAGLRARFGRAIAEHDRYDRMGLFRELEALGDALVRRATPFDGLKIITCRFQSH
ncbi:MAG: hypothetical protein EBZ50_02560, partial [Alphaproteobacteria bacterium]|nr:hypothetical protein [Alphaproteobacteria bacterium]